MSLGGGGVCFDSSHFGTIKRVRSELRWLKCLISIYLFADSVIVSVQEALSLILLS